MPTPQMIWFMLSRNLGVLWGRIYPRHSRIRGNPGRRIDS